MKLFKSCSAYLIIFLLLMLCFFQKTFSQDRIIGNWDGIFMNDFKVQVSLFTNNQNQYEGTIKMYDGDNLIQNDKIEDIKLVNEIFTFYIPDKETSFEGSFNDQMTELSGNFVFPDGSLHTLQLKRAMTETITIEEFTLLKEKKIDEQKLHSDLIFLYKSLKEHHPQLYAFTSKDSIDKLVENIENEISTTLTLEEFYLQTIKLSDAIKCSHTGLKLPYAYQNLIKSFGNYFPIKLFFTSGKAFYISGAKDINQISPGNEIISINNKPINEIITQTFYYISAEGCNTTTKYNELNKRFNTLFYLLDDSEAFDIKFKTGNSIKKTTVYSCNFEDLNLDNDNLVNNKRVDFFYVDNKPLGMLKVSSFAIPEMDNYFNQLDSIFSDLKRNNTENLILDLRNNSGGHPIFAAQLLSYLTDKDFVYFKRNEEIKEFEPLYNPMKPNKLNFNGNLYVLINGGSLSTTGHLISLLKFYTNAIFIGEEPGSTFRCNDFSMQLTLPNTGVLLNVPRTTFTTSVTGFTLCEPFPIDYKININIKEIINKEDTYVEMVKTICWK